jgi:stearoyl-CoA desaturase (delta-9 desaturase)
MLAPALFRRGTLPSTAAFPGPRVDPRAEAVEDERYRPLEHLPVILLHGAPLLLFVTGATTFDWAVCALLFTVRMLAITVGYHRLLCHRAFRAGRLVQFALALVGASAAQHGPLWWASIHLRHHRHADSPLDPHSPRRGLFWSYLGWNLCRKYDGTDLSYVRHLTRFPELVWLERFDWIPPALLALATLVVGGWSCLVVGFLVSTLLVLQANFALSWVAHNTGARAFQTKDDSGNVAWLALVTFGEGWHNNHHAFPASASFGFRWYEVDMGYWLIRALAAVRLVSSVRVPSARVRERRRRQGQGRASLAAESCR